MTRQVAKVVCNGEYKVIGAYDGRSVNAPFIIYRCEYGHRKQIRKCNSLHEALGVLANILIQY
jgi:hypothetical protein